MTTKAKTTDYFGLDKMISLILAIIPCTAWICGAITRIQEGKIVAGILRLFFGGTVVWIVDLVLMIKHGTIWRFLDK